MDEATSINGVKRQTQRTLKAADTELKEDMCHQPNQGFRSTSCVEDNVTETRTTRVDFFKNKIYDVVKVVVNKYFLIRLQVKNNYNNNNNKSNMYRCTLLFIKLQNSISVWI